MPPLLRAEIPDYEVSISCTRIEDSVRGHLIGFRADRAMEEGVVQEIPQFTAP